MGDSLLMMGNKLLELSYLSVVLGFCHSRAQSDNTKAVSTLLLMLLMLETGKR